MRTVIEFMDVASLSYGYGSGSWILGLEWILGKKPVSYDCTYIHLSDVAL